MPLRGRIASYGMEVVLPFEVEVPSQKILAESGLEESEWAQTRYDQLNLIEGKRLTAMSHGHLYQQRIKNAFDKKVCPRKFNQGDLVLKKISHAVKDNRGKWAPNYKGPFVVKRAFFWGGSGTHQHGWRGTTLAHKLRCR